MSEELLTRLHASPDVYVQKLDLVREAALLVQFDLRAYQAASFLDDRILTPALKGGWVPLAGLVEEARRIQQQRPLHFIFHTGHVGSTLISRLLDATGVILPLREPLTLRTLADAHDLLGQPDSLLSEAQFGALEGALMNLWSRGYDPTSAVLLKATSSTGRMARPLLTRHAAARAIYLNIAVEPYLATLLAGKNSSVDLRGHGPPRIRRLQSRIDSPIAPLHSLSSGELAAMSWLAETWNQQDTARAIADRVIAVDFDRFLASVESGIAEILRHFELPFDAEYLSGLSRSQVLTRYSKAAEFEYSPSIRSEILNESRRRNRAEIRKGVSWLDSLAKSERDVAEILNQSDRLTVDS